MTAMKAFDYHKPGSVPEAAALFASGSEIRPLAGGMSLLPTMKQRLSAPSAVIDLSGIPALKGISVGADTITIGAMTRHADVARSPEVLKALPALAQLAGGIGDPAVRNRGTIGGSLANNDPNADYPAAALALGATIVTSTREIAADQFFRGMFETALAPGELITAVKLPIPSPPATRKCRTRRRGSRWSASLSQSSPTACASL
jgi:carbon-monoxide dehydrogenase medium subunit